MRRRFFSRLCCVLTLAGLAGAAGGFLPAAADEKLAEQTNFQRDQLVAWCIVPFDAKQRGPEARAIMVRGLGMTRVAYDWRDVHVPTFEEEILQYKKHNIEFFAFWGWHDTFEPLIAKH